MAALSPPIGVVVATRDRPELLDRCLAALGASLRPGDEMVVVDSASTQPAVTEVAIRRGARLLRCDRPGTSRARNAGAALVSCEVVAFVDDDVTVAAGWADAVSAAFAAHPMAVFVTGRLAVPAHQAHCQRPVAVLDHPRPEVLGAAMDPLLGHGANLAVRKAAFDLVGGFDPRLGPGTPLRAAEDHDLFDRLLAAGFEGRYEPAAAGWHDQWRGRWRLLGREWSYGVGTGGRLARLSVTWRDRSRSVAYDTLWRTGLRTVPGSVRHRYEFGLAFVLVRLVATGWGMALAWATPGFVRTPTGTRPPSPSPPARGHGMP